MPPATVPCAGASLGEPTRIHTVATHRTQDRRRLGWRTLAGWCVLFAWLLAAATRASAQEPPALLLDPARAPLEVVGSPGWFGPSALADITLASKGALAFAPGAGEQRLPFASRRSLWLKLRLQRSAPGSQAWYLQVPVTIVDRVTLYQQDATGQWVGASAGDMVPARDWPKPGRYPTFSLRLADQAPSEVFLEVRHSADMKVPLRIVTAREHEERTQLEYLALGTLMGVLTLLVVSSLVRALLLRDGAHAWYSGFAALAMLSVAAFSGVAGQFLWGRAPAWSDAAPGVLTLLGSSIAAWLFARLALLATGGSWLGTTLRGLAIAGPVLALLYVVLDRSFGVWMLGLQPLLVGVCGLLASVLTYRRGDVVGIWMLLGSLPLCLSVLLSLLRVTGLLPPSWWSEYLLVLALTLNLPMMLIALNSRTEVRRSVELRRIALASQDALTGLMKRGPFQARLHQAVLRHRNIGESAGVALIELRNFEWIRSNRGEEAAEEALLRTVITLRRLVRDVDTSGRVGENIFGLIVEGAALREGMTRIASRLIATGLMQDAQQPGEPELRLHIAAVMLNEHTAPAEELMRDLRGLLASMSLRTHRPLRFYDPHAAASDSSWQPAAPSGAPDPETSSV
jgi:diguanylate cyclase (GGDEF)-like protein